MNHIVLSENLDSILLKKWIGMVEWTMKFLCTVDCAIAHCILAAFIPFYPVRPQKGLLYCCKATIYASIQAYLYAHDL